MVRIKSLLGRGLFAVAVLALASCSQGFDNNELWTSSVSNSQLESPAESDVTFSRVFNADGTQSVKVSWPVVYGASGYECIVNIVDNVENPQSTETVYNEIVDGTSFLFTRERDTYYQVSIRPLGNTERNNTDAATPIVLSHSTYVQPIQLAAGNLVSSINTILTQYGDPEYIFELEAGAEYTVDSEIDFGESMVTLTGDDSDRPLITLGANGVIRTSAGLTIEEINFDCGTQSNSDITGIVELSASPSSNMSAEAQGVLSGKSGSAVDCYVLQSPIILQNCAFKNVKKCLFCVGQCSWGVSDVRVINCVVQLDNDGTNWGDASVISAYSKAWKAPSGGQFWYGGIKDITIKNSTIYNLQSNSKNRMIRFNNKDLDRVFPTAVGSATITDNTFYRTFDDKEFGNNTPNASTYTITFNNNVCYDVFRLQKFIQGNCTLNIDVASNTVWGVKNSVDGTDKTRCATEEDPAFTGPTEQALDFTQTNFGVNFKATGAISSTVGDPRWLN